MVLQPEALAWPPCDNRSYPDVRSYRHRPGAGDLQPARESEADGLCSGVKGGALRQLATGNPPPTDTRGYRHRPDAIDVRTARESEADGPCWGGSGLYAIPVCRAGPYHSAHPRETYIQELRTDGKNTSYAPMAVSLG